MKQIVKIRFGSHLYGTNTPESDLDYKSVYIPDGTDILMQSFNARSVITTSTKKDTSVKNTPLDIDDESFSLIKFFGMLRVGDMIASELLFAPLSSMTIMRPEWKTITDRRELLINRNVAGFVGYCKKQAAKYGIKGSRVAAVRNALRLLTTLANRKDVATTAKLGMFERLIEEFCQTTEYASIVEIEQPSGLQLKHWEICDRKLPFTISIQQAINIIQKVIDNYGHRALQAEANEGIDWKAVAHAVRVGEQAIELVITKKITFPRPNAEELLAIKHGKIPYVQIAERLEQLLDDVLIASAHSSLPEAIDEQFVNDYIIDAHFNAVNAKYGRKR